MVSRFPTAVGPGLQQVANNIKGSRKASAARKQAVANNHQTITIRRAFVTGKFVFINNNINLAYVSCIKERMQGEDQVKKKKQKKTTF